MKKYGKILVIDDEPDIGEVITELLSPIFEKVYFCDNVPEALGVLKTTELSAVLSDINMPNFSGKDLVIKMRSNGNLTPVIFVTGYLDQNIALAALRLGVSDVIEKPFKGDDLIASVDRVLEIHKRQKQLLCCPDNKDLEQRKKMVGLLQIVNFKSSKSAA